MKHDEHQMLQYSILLSLNFWWAYIYFSTRYLKKRVDFIIVQTFCSLRWLSICKVNFAMREVQVSLRNTFSISWKIWKSVHVILWTTVPYDLKKEASTRHDIHLKSAFIHLLTNMIQYSSAYVKWGKMLDKQKRLQTTKSKRTRLFLTNWQRNN